MGHQNGAQRFCGANLVGVDPAAARQGFCSCSLRGAGVVLCINQTLSCSVAPFPPHFFCGCPTKNGLPQKGFLFFAGSLSVAADTQMLKPTKSNNALPPTSMEVDPCSKTTILLDRGLCTSMLVGGGYGLNNFTHGSPRMSEGWLKVKVPHNPVLISQDVLYHAGKVLFLYMVLTTLLCEFNIQIWVSPLLAGCQQQAS